MAACAQFVEHEPKRKYVSCRCQHLSARLLGRHVAERSNQQTRAQAFLGASHILRQSEIDYLEVAVGANHDVLGFDIAMNNPVAVSGCQCFSDLNSHSRHGSGAASASRKPP